MDARKVRELEHRLYYEFTEKNHLVRALTHPTFTNIQKQNHARDCPNQETYAILGDAVLRVVLVTHLMKRGFEKKGKLTSEKIRLETNRTLAVVAKRIRLLEDGYILHAIGPEEKVREAAQAVTSDTLEALIGAIFIDSDYSFASVKNSILRLFAPELREIERNME